MFFEILGVIGTAFIVIAFLLNGEKKIRIFDMIGAMISIIYGICIGAFSVVLLNSILTIIHIYKLIKLNKKG